MVESSPKASMGRSYSLVYMHPDFLIWRFSTAHLHTLDSQLFVNFSDFSFRAMIQALLSFSCLFSNS